MCYRRLAVQEKAHPLDSRSYSSPSPSMESLPSSSSLNGVPWHRFIPAASIAACRLTFAAPSHQPGFGETSIDRNTYGITNFLTSLENDVQVRRLSKARSILGYHRSVQTNISPQSNVCHPPRNGQACRRPAQPPGLNTRVCLGFIPKTLFIFQKLLYVAYWIGVVLNFIYSVGQKFQRGGWRKTTLVTAEAVLAVIQPPAGVSVRISTGGRHGFGASAPLSTRT